MPAIPSKPHPVSSFPFRVSCFVICVFCAAACLPSESDRKLLESGFSQYSARQFDQSQSAADQFIRKNPDADNIDEAYYLRGLSRMSKNVPAERPAAAQDFQTAIAKTKRPDLKAKANRALGDMAYDSNHWQDAITAYQASLAAAPSSTTATDAHIHYRIGAAYQNLGQWDKAKPFFQKVITLNADPVLTQRSISRVDAKSFTLQFGAFRDAPRAAELVKQLKTPPAGAAPIIAITATEMREGQLLYLVRSGSYPTLAEADTARTRLLPKYPTITVFP